IPPVAQDDASLANTPGATVSVDVIADNGNGVDADPDGSLDATSVSLVLPGGETMVVLDGDGDVIGFTVPGEGVWEVNPVTGAVSFAPEAGFTQDPTPVNYTIDDNDGNVSNEATITIDYVPVAVDDTSTGNTTGSPVSVAVTGNDTDGDVVDPTTIVIDPTDADGDGDPSTLTVPGEGTWTTTPAGEIVFTPEPTFTSDPTPITYTVADDEGNVSNPATVTVTFTPQPPVAVDDTSTGNMTNMPVTVNVIGNDNDPDGTLDPTTIVIDPTDADGDGDPSTLTVPGEGTWTTTPAGEIVFTPEPGFTGSPTPITYTIDDNDGNTSNEATVTVVYDAQPPVAQDDASLANTPGATVSVDVIADNGNGVDADPDGSLDATSVSLVLPGGETMVVLDGDGDVIGFTVPGEGVWEVNPVTGAVSFAPEAGFTQDPTPVNYTIDDNDGNVSNEATITIDYVPVAVDDTSTGNTTGSPVSVAVTGNDTDGDVVDPTTIVIDPTDADGDGDPSTLTVPGEGTWTTTPAGEIVFTPEPTFTSDPTPITYTVADDEGNVSNPATVTVTFDPCNGLGTADCDGDGTPNNMDPDPNNPCVDDGITGDEDTSNLIWQAEDCDGDGEDNGTETSNGTDPEDPCDGGNLANVDLMDTTSDWYVADCDGDGVPNGTEVDP
ncbi:Ig-like domain-containing protein, partial [Winogradskyella wandonensis]|uniref:Ig-like domain-containing protein n=1 Tax=Winogradskyella wandonensis TaxID=1442586 RepID=UPI0018EE5D1F